MQNIPKIEIDNEDGFHQLMYLYMYIMGRQTDISRYRTDLNLISIRLDSLDCLLIIVSHRSVISIIFFTDHGKIEIRRSIISKKNF